MRTPHSLLLGVLAGLTLCSFSRAQLPPQPNIVWVNDNTQTGNGNAFPFGSDGIRYQTLVTNATMGMAPAMITDVFVNAGTYVNNEVVYGDIEIKMGKTPVTALSNAWTTNNPNPTTVYRGPLRVRFKTGLWTGIGMPATYFWLPTSTSDNLCIEVIVWSVIDKGVYSQGQNFYYPLAQSSVPRTYLYGWVQGGGYSNATLPGVGTGGAKLGLLFNDGNMVDLGTGCKSSVQTNLAISFDAGKWPRQGQPFNLNLSGAGNNQLGFVLLGSNDQTWGSLTLPLDLAVINAPGCKVWNDVLVSLGTVTNASGSATYALQLPAGFVGLRLYASFGVLDPGANPLGFVTSNYAKLYVGN